MAGSPTVGVLALQGDVREHAALPADLGAQVVPVRRPAALATLRGRGLPGGGSSVLATPAPVGRSTGGPPGVHCAAAGSAASDGRKPPSCPESEGQRKTDTAVPQIVAVAPLSGPPPSMGRLKLIPL